SLPAERPSPSDPGRCRDADHPRHCTLVLPPSPQGGTPAARVAGRAGLVVPVRRNGGPGAGRMVPGRGTGMAVDHRARRGGAGDRIPAWRGRAAPSDPLIGAGVTSVTAARA